MDQCRGKEYPTMKRFVPVIAAFAAAACFVASVAKADAWEDYNKLMDHYYRANRQLADKITCHINSSAFDDMEKVLGRHPLTLKNAVKDFSITVEKGKDVSFNVPVVEVDTGQPSDEHVKKRVPIIIESIQRIVSGIIAGTMVLPKEQMKNLAVRTKDGATIVSYDTEMEKVEATYMGNTEEMKVTSPYAAFLSKATYISLGDKLAVAASTTQNADGSQKFESTIAVTYQRLGQNYFPARIINDRKEGSGVEHVEVNLEDCTVGE
jgi:hypothetical protein